MKNKQQVTNSGLGLSTIVFLIFLVMKLAGIGQVAAWSWWWVCSPLWIPAGIVLGIAIIFFIVVGIISAFVK